MAVTKVRPGQVLDLFNQGVAGQVTGSGDTYLTGTALSIAGVKVGTKVRYRFAITKTGAGVATPIWTVRTGTTGTISDTARLTFTGLAQTAVIDTAFVEIEVIFRTVGSSTTAVIAGVYFLTHNLSITGFATLQSNVVTSVSSGFDSTVASTIIGVSVNSGASSAWTFVLTNAEIINTN